MLASSQAKKRSSHNISERGRRMRLTKFSYIKYHFSQKIGRLNGSWEKLRQLIKIVKKILPVPKYQIHRVCLSALFSKPNALYLLSTIMQSAVKRMHGLKRGSTWTSGLLSMLIYLGESEIHILLSIALEVFRTQIIINED